MFTFQRGLKPRENISSGNLLVFTSGFFIYSRIELFILKPNYLKKISEKIIFRKARKFD